MLRQSLCISYPSHNYLTRNSHEMLLPFPRVEEIRMNFKHQFVKIRLEVPEYIKCKRSYLQFINAPSEFYLAHYLCSPLLNPVCVFFSLYLLDFSSKCFAHWRLIGMTFVYLIYKDIVVSMLLNYIFYCVFNWNYFYILLSHSELSFSMRYLYTIFLYQASTLSISRNYLLCNI